MLNFLSVYKFDLSFEDESKYNKAFFDSIANDIESSLLYSGIYLEKTYKDSKKYSNLNFKSSEFDIFLSVNYSGDYFLPSFYLKFDYDPNKFNLKGKETFFKSFFESFYGLGSSLYIFDLSKKALNIFPDYLFCLSDIEKNFNPEFSLKQIFSFLEKNDKIYLESFLNNNIKIKKDFIFMLYNCFLLYLNSLKGNNNILKLENILINPEEKGEYKSNAKLIISRLNHINNLNISFSSKYKNMLDKLFTLLSK